MTVTMDELVGVLRTMLIVNSRDPKWLRRGRKITVQYEFPGHGAYWCRAEGPDWVLEPGSLPDEECDIVVRTSPEALHGILHGSLGGREAMVSGRLSLRKAPAMPTLLVLRAMFNRYTKAAARGQLGEAT